MIRLSLVMNRMNFFFNHLARALLALVIGLFFSSLWSLAQELAWEEDEEVESAAPGLLAEYQVDADRYLQVDPDMLWVGISEEEPGEWRPDARLPLKPFRAVWTGQLNIRESGEYTFHFFGLGRFQLVLADRLVLSSESSTRGWHSGSPIDLSFGRTDIRIEFECHSSTPSLGLFWEGPSFGLEPITSQHFSHSPGSAETSLVQQGRVLSRAYRCSACHEFPRDEPILKAPSLTRVRGNLNPHWIMDYLTNQHASSKSLPEHLRLGDSDSANDAAQGRPPPQAAAPQDRRMPEFDFTTEQASAIVAALMEASEEVSPLESNSPATTSGEGNKADGTAKDVVTTESQGQAIFVSQGCIACHTVGQLGRGDGTLEAAQDGWFSGGDLHDVCFKRPTNAIDRWLQDPNSINPSHRMPEFDLSAEQRTSLLAWFESLNLQSPPTPESNWGSPSQVLQWKGDSEIGRTLIAEHRCAACHEMPASLSEIQLPRVAIAASQQWERENWDREDWDRTCLGSRKLASGTPDSRFSQSQLAALQAYLSSTETFHDYQHPDQLIAENNCMACHRRDGRPGIADHFASILEHRPELSDRLASMVPPALDSIGDKLHRKSLQEAIDQPLRSKRRPWLEIQMPRFHLSDDQLDRIVDYFISRDRIPAGNPASESESETDPIADQAFWLAAGRLVTPDGFSCQACHAIGDSQPVGAALNAHGADLTMLGSRIREPWFYRWVKNPSRIVPRMEMPAIQTAVPGILEDSLDLQLRALWLTLNRPDFRPPKPNPVRVVRNHHLPGVVEPVQVLTDVLEAPHRFVRPLLLGLPNRHNWLVDLETGRTSRWWLGDVARQYTRGKSWYWEPGSPPLLDSEWIEEMAIQSSSGDRWTPSPPEGRQFAWELDRLEHLPLGVRWHGRLHFRSPDGLRTQWLKIADHWQPVDSFSSRLQRTVEGLAAGQRLQIAWSGRINKLTDQSWRVDFGRGHSALIQAGPMVKLTATDGQSIDLHPASDHEPLQLSIEYRSSIASDSVQVAQVAPLRSPPIPLSVVPGFDAVQLPLPRRRDADRASLGPIRPDVYQFTQGTSLSNYRR
jgi:mono/diheme cytochrome c family protein